MSNVPNVGAIIAKSKARDLIYGAYLITGLALVTTQNVFAFLITEEAIASQPLWLGSAFVAWTTLGLGGFAVAKANTPTKEPFQ